MLHQHLNLKQQTCKHSIKHIFYWYFNIIFLSIKTYLITEYASLMIKSWSKCLTPVALGAISLKTTSIGRPFKSSLIFFQVLTEVKSEFPNTVTPSIGYIC